jgi:hypothetical protein
MTDIAIKRLEFARGEGDVLATGRVRLDAAGPEYNLFLLWMPHRASISQVDAPDGSWVLDMSTTDGRAIVSGAWVRDRVDCLLGVSSDGRPNGGIMAYDPKGRGDPGENAWSTDGVLLLYVPGGLDPADFAAYTTAVA